MANADVSAPDSMYATTDIDLDVFKSILDTGTHVLDTIVGAASAKASQEREQEFQLQKLDLLGPSSVQIQAAVPWVALGGGALLLILLLRRRR